MAGIALHILHVEAHALDVVPFLALQIPHQEQQGDDLASVVDASLGPLLTKLAVKLGILDDTSIYPPFCDVLLKLQTPHFVYELTPFLPNLGEPGIFGAIKELLVVHPREIFLIRYGL